MTCTSSREIPSYTPALPLLGTRSFFLRLPWCPLLFSQVLDPVGWAAGDKAGILLRLVVWRPFQPGGGIRRIACVRWKNNQEVRRWLTPDQLELSTESTFQTSPRLKLPRLRSFFRRHFAGPLGPTAHGTFGSIPGGELCGSTSTEPKTCPCRRCPTSVEPKCMKTRWRCYRRWWPFWFGFHHLEALWPFCGYAAMQVKRSSSQESVMLDHERFRALSRQK